MIIDARIAEAYISGEDLERYKDDWIYYCFGRQSVFESSAPESRGWVSELYKKIREELENFAPHNEETVKKLFPQFDRVTGGCTIRLAVGFPDPYDAMVLEHDGQPCLVFDLYCTPVKFAVQPDCRPPAKCFPGDATVNPGGLQYNSVSGRLAEKREYLQQNIDP